MPGNNSTRRKANNMLSPAERKAAVIARVRDHMKIHTNADKRRKLRLIRAIELHGVNANHNAILAAENAIGNQQEANYAAEKAAARAAAQAANQNNTSKRSKSKNPGNASRHSKNKKAANNGPTTWVTYQGKYQKMTVKRAKELGLK